MKTLVTFRLILIGGLCVLAADECQPHTWQWNGRRGLPDMAAMATATAAPLPPKRHPRRDIEAKPGELNCRNWAQTYDRVGYWTCNELAEAYSLTIEQFWELNPELAPDCDGIKVNTEYCVSGFVEVLRSTDGSCGPNHKNATCLGTDFGQCCNAETWRCGGTEHDCAPGVCYEGFCAGHTVYTTDGTCGYDYDYSQCAGKWGDCCSFQEGRCGTGPDFCGEGRCQSGNCTVKLGF